MAATPIHTVIGGPARPRITTFKGDVVRLASGTGIAQLIGIAAAPLLARIFAPEAFGLAALFASITSIVAIIACLRYELAIVLPEDDRHASHLVWASLAASAIVASAVAVLVWIASPWVAATLNSPDLAHYLWLVPIAVAVHGIFQTLNYWNTRTRQFNRLSKARVTSAMTTTAWQLGAGLAGHATGGTMITAQVGGQAIAGAVLGGQIWRDSAKFLITGCDWEGIRAAMKRYRKFPVFSTWTALLNTASWQLPTLMLGAFFSSTVVGWYALGFRILQLPMNLIGGAIAQVFLQRAAEARIDGTLGNIVEKMLKRLISVGMFPMLLLAVVGRDLYTIVFGAQWMEAGVFAEILSVWGFVWFVSSPVARIFIVMEMQEFSLKLNMVIFCSRVGALAIGGYLENVYIALGLFAATGIVLYGYQIAVAAKVAKVPSQPIVREIMKSLLHFAPCGAVLLIMRAYDYASFPLAAAATGLFMIHVMRLYQMEQT